MDIHEVTTRADLRRFIQFRYDFYRGDPVWVPPLRSEQWAQFDPQKNPMLKHCETSFFLATEGKHILGRVAAFIDSLAVKHWGMPIGLFGSYECVDDSRASRLLLDTAFDWLRTRGMSAVRGPWSFASQEWGAVIEGFTPEPVVMAPYNPPYYNDQFTAYGLAKAMDLLVYIADLREGYVFPERYLTLTDKVMERYNVSVRAVDMRRWEEEVEAILKVINISIAPNWGFYPVTDEESHVIAHDLKQIINPDSVLVAEDAEGKPIGFSVPIPDINVLLKGLNGRLLPFGWLKMLWGVPRLRQYRLWALGVLPEYHGKGIDALLYRKTYEALKSRDVRMEINYVLETNTNMNNALHRLDVKPLRKYRVYEKQI